jgi:serine/threonine protein kinase
MAPELYSKKYDHRVDVFAFGILLVEVYDGRDPFELEEDQYNIVNALFDYFHHYYHYYVV